MRKPFGLKPLITIGKDGMGGWVLSTKENIIKDLSVEEVLEMHSLTLSLLKDISDLLIKKVEIYEE